MDTIPGYQLAAVVPGKILAMHDIGWAILICSTAGPYVYTREGELRPLGVAD